MTSNRAQELMRKFRRHRVLVIGDAFLDHYVYGKVHRLNPEAPTPLVHVEREEDRTGGAGNTAKNTAALGAKTTLVSVVGDDAIADTIESVARTEGYRPRLLRDLKRSTIRKTRYLVGSQQLLRVDYEQTDDISAATEKKIIAALRKCIEEGVDAILVSDYAKGVITQRVAEAILDEAGQNGVLVAADVKPSRAPYFVGASFISPNLKEAREFLKVHPEDTSIAPADLARMLCNQMSADVYLTMGADGIYVDCGGDCGVHVPQQHVAEVFDVSGAGDTAIAVILLSLLSGASEVEAAELANAAGAVVVGKVGSSIVAPEELLEMVCNHGA